MRKRKSTELFAVKETTVCMNSCLADQFSMGVYLRDLSSDEMAWSDPSMTQLYIGKEWMGSFKTT